MGAGEGGRNLEETSTWAIATICAVLVVISIIIEHGIHLSSKWLEKHHNKALREALEKVKSELMLLGFVSLLLTVGQGIITEICVPKSVADSWHPCKKEVHDDGGSKSHESGKSHAGRRLLHDSDSMASFRRVLSGGVEPDKCASHNKVPFISADGLHQLHIFIFVLAVFHLLYCITTMALGSLKMRRWKSWELETRTAEYQFSHDPDRFRLARDTSFGHRHLNFWSKSPILTWIVCFFRQFVGSVQKVDYLTLRHGFIMAHLAPQSSSKFDFRNYIKRSLEEDMKAVVGISPPLWSFAVLFLLFNTHGWHSYQWHPFIPLIIILLVGTKLQVIIIKMASQITERGDVVKGVPVVHPTDDLFWFKCPRFMLYLIHFVLFQNAFQLAFFAWSWYEFGFPSCFHQRVDDIIIRFSMGVLIQVLCSYVTLPLYALVTQMGSNMRPTIFSDRVATALRKWHHTARNHLKENTQFGRTTPLSTSTPNTPTSGSSRAKLLRHLQKLDSFQGSSSRCSFSKEYFNIERSPFPSYHTINDFSQQQKIRPQQEVPSPSNHTINGLSSQQQKIRPQQEVRGVEREMQELGGSAQLPPLEDSNHQHRIEISPDIIFDRREE
ncbi:MLO-like protein 2 [Elaeis guineensis]|uniref:MLO-like protein n=1 Tax=Elaeis guineensis var. tenera TaxID=51953 RepID=A0A8N4F2H0_ELAGV|nr:MLO-like protein 2 [Elaeis guineensis]